MPTTRVINSRVDDAALARARDAHPALAGVDTSRLIRVALHRLAGLTVPEAIAAADGQKRGRKPQAERESAGCAA